MHPPRQGSLPQKAAVLPERSPHHNMDAEQAVLGEILLAAQSGGTDAVTKNIAALGEEAFYAVQHRVIYRTIERLHHAGLVPDLITVTDELRRLERLDGAGGAAYLTGLVGSVFSTALLPQHVGILRALWAKRFIAELAGEVFHAAQNGSSPGALISALGRGLESFRELNSDVNGLNSGSNRIQTTIELLEGAGEDQRWWPLWGQPGIVGPGVATLISGHAKVAGKTTAIGIGIRDLFRVVPDLSVLVLTEEPQSLWRGRLRRWGISTPNWRFRFADGTPWLTVLQQVKQETFNLLVVDTLRAFTGIVDENDASAVVAAIQPLVLLARSKHIGVVALHHLRKTEGEEGLAHAGSTALVGLFDVALELRRDQHAPGRRIMTAVSRFEETPKALALEMRGEELVVLGSPEAVALNEVAERVFTAIPPESQLTMLEICGALDEPKPSREQVSRAIRQLRAEGRVTAAGRGVKGDPQRWGRRL
jgi:DnaB helicase-like protein/AAA domain-containing protein